MHAMNGSIGWQQMHDTDVAPDSLARILDGNISLDRLMITAANVTRLRVHTGEVCNFPGDIPALGWRVGRCSGVSL